MQLQDKVALITGGSQGLGLALAHQLGKRGARVAIVARGEAQLAQALDGLHAARIHAVAIRADVADKQAVYPIIGQAQAALGAIDIVVHNASTLGPTPLRPLLETDCEQLARVLEVNVLGPFRLSKALVPGMLVRGEGAVVHISSDAAVVPYAGWGAYGASKAALDHLARTLAAELADSPLRVLAVDPGEMDTAMHRAALPDADPSRLAAPADVARRIVQLLETPERHPSGTRVDASEVELWS